VRGVYLAQSASLDDQDLEQYQPAARAFVAAPWPAELSPIRRRLSSAGIVTTPVAGARLTLLRSPIVASVPALVLPVPIVEMIDLGSSRSAMSHSSTEQTIVVLLDRQYIETAFLPSLAARLFPEEGSDTYRFAIVDPGDPSAAVFSRGVPAGTQISAPGADASAPLFAFRPELLDQMIGTMPRTAIFRGGSVNVTTSRKTGDAMPRTTTTGTNQQFSVYVEQRSTAAETRTGRGGANAASELTKRFTNFVGPGLALSTAGAWQLVLQHPAGSLEAAVAQVRRRNLTLSFGILSLLCVSVGLILVNAQRLHRLAGQQIDFVATVSHELRTPLAVIRSAAQNLSAGVVHEPAEARRYGALIEGEGRRLTEMIEQVLDYAGLAGDRHPRLTSSVDVGTIVRELVETSRALPETEGIDVSVNIDADLPVVLADEGALRRAIQNLVTNAIKYGAAGRWIGIDAKRSAGHGRADVQITVSDRGPGIDAGDLPHIFEPFYRGAPARDRQIHGNGLGLSLVKRIAEAHGGHVSVRSAAGQGASFTIALPAASGLPDRHDVEATLPLPQLPAGS
jgi:signal transduction histidine kinase